MFGNGFSEFLENDLEMGAYFSNNSTPFLENTQYMAPQVMHTHHDLVYS